MRAPERQNNGIVKYLDIRKNRFDGELGFVPFEFNKKNQRFRYSVYLRYWYKSTNTDGRCCCQGALERRGGGADRAEQGHGQQLVKAYVSIRGAHREHTSAYEAHTSAYVSIQRR